MAFGNILRNLLEENNLTQKQLGLGLNIAPSTIGNYVRNIREPDHATLMIFAKYFNVSTDYLLGHIVDEESSPKEQQLITLYRNLNEDYQEIIIRQAAVLKEIQKEKNENRPH